MALDDVTRRAVYTGNGTQKDFPFAFVVFTTTDIAVRQTLEGETETVVDPGAYTVVLNEDQDNSPGGTVRFAVSPANGTRLAILSVIPETQPMQLTTHGGFDPRVLNSSADRIVALVQQLDERLERTIAVDASEPLTPEELKQKLLSAQAEAQKHADAAKISADAAKASEEATKEYAEAATIIEPFAGEIQTVAGHITQVDQVAGVVADGTLKKAADSIEITTENVRLAQAAQTAAEAANTSAQSAKAAASASESAAAHSAQDATTQASAAASSAQDAANSSSQANASAQAAAGSADSAKAYAEQAQASANNAQGSATTATSKAQEASASAQAAAQSAKVAAFAFRITSANLSASGSANVSTLLPQTNIKVGDSVVDADGDVFPITAISGSTFTVGAKTASVRGPQGVKGDTGKTGPTGAPGLNGAKGDTGPAGTITAVTATVDGTTGVPNCSVVVGGTPSARTFQLNFTGLKGPRGETGAPLAIKGSYATVEELKQAHPTGALGDAYMVGSHLYSWNGSAWQDVGELKGPQGDTGPRGPAGKDGAPGAQGPQGLQGPAGKDGAQGPAGKDGTAGVISSVTASVGATTGTPACEVTLGGTPSNRTIALAFTGLKGETGPTPDVSKFALKDEIKGMVKSVNGTTPDSGGNVALAITWESVSGKPATFAPSTHTHPYLPLAGGTCTGTVFAPAFQISSDRRLKSELVRIENPLEKMDALCGYTYLLRGCVNRQAGLIAQDVESVLPEAVVENEDGIKTINYAAVVALLLNAVKELRSEINRLKESKNGN